MASVVQPAPLVKELAANDRPTRDKAVASLRTYLGGRRKFDDLELLKLWKGLFFCMWMSDRPRTQQRLALDLAGLVEVLPSENVVPFLEAFWRTMAREWNGIDVMRVDKFLLLVRSYTFTTFKLLVQRGWDEEGVKETTDLLSSIPLHPTDNKIPNGLRYHVIDVYVDELHRADPPRTSNTLLENLLEPLKYLQKASPTKSVRVRAKEALADERREDWKRPTENNDPTIQSNIS